jgi:hypothetical protein
LLVLMLVRCMRLGSMRLRVAMYLGLRRRMLVRLWRRLVEVWVLWSV